HFDLDDERWRARSTCHPALFGSTLQLIALHHEVAIAGKGKPEPMEVFEQRALAAAHSFQVVLVELHASCFLVEGRHRQVPPVFGETTSPHDDLLSLGIRML